MKNFTTRLTLTGIVAIIALVALTRVVAMLNGPDEDLIVGAFGGVALIAATYKSMSFVWSVR